VGCQRVEEVDVVVMAEVDYAHPLRRLQMLYHGLPEHQAKHVSSTCNAPLELE